MNCRAHTKPYIRIINMTCHNYELHRHESHEKWFIAANTPYSLSLPYSENCPTLYRMVKTKHCSSHNLCRCGHIRDECTCDGKHKHHHKHHDKHHHKHHDKHHDKHHHKHHKHDKHHDEITFWINQNGEICRAMGSRSDCGTQVMIKRGFEERRYPYGFVNNIYGQSAAINANLNGINNTLYNYCPDLTGNVLVIY